VKCRPEFIPGEIPQRDDFRQLREFPAARCTGVCKPDRPKGSHLLPEMGHTVEALPEVWSWVAGAEALRRPGYPEGHPNLAAD